MHAPVNRSPAGDTGTLWYLQYLRFAAAMLVVALHVFEMNTGTDTAVVSGRFDVGAAGVDIFFVISGFIMVHVTSRRETRPLDFFMHRLLRVGPPYWIVTLVFAAMVLIAPGLVNNSVLSLPHLLASLGFVAWYHPTLHETLPDWQREALPLLIVGWTLNYEFAFYLVFAIALRWWDRRVAIASPVLIAVVGAVAASGTTEQIAVFYGRPILLEFILGMALGLAVVRGWRLPKAAALAVLIVGIAALAASAHLIFTMRISPYRVITYGLPAALIVTGAVMLELAGEPIRIRALLLLGNASYALYLTHYFVIGLVRAAYHRLPSLLPGEALPWLTAIAAIVGALAFHRYVEKPATKGAKRAWRALAPSMARQRLA